MAFESDCDKILKLLSKNVSQKRTETFETIFAKLKCKDARKVSEALTILDSDGYIITINGNICISQTGRSFINNKSYVGAKFRRIFRVVIELIAILISILSFVISLQSYRSHEERIKYLEQRIK